jgi:hypothetical protein
MTKTLVSIARRKAGLTRPQTKVHQHDNHKTNADDRRAPFLIVDSFDVAALADLVDTPDVQHETVDEGHGGEDGKCPRGAEGDVVIAEVEQSGSDGAEEDGEFEPGEEGSLGGEVDLGFDADGDVDACMRETWRDRKD